jgi:threonine/homoserine/homoserine lactone efflux protein
MSPDLLLYAAAAGASYTLIPGPAFLALLGIGAGQGRRAGAGFLLGHFAGDVVWASLALGAILGARSASPLLFNLLGLVCGAYLCWLGMTALTARTGPEGRLTSDPRRPVLRGLAFGLTNPKGYPVSLAMFTALLSGSATRLHWSSFPALLAAACCGFVAADVILVAVVGAGVIRAAYRRYALWITRASGLLFIGFGLHAILSATASPRSEA